VNVTGIGLLLWNLFLPSATSPARYVAAISCLLALAAMQFVSAAFYPPDDPKR
jgi:hypothetical protein